MRTLAVKTATAADRASVTDVLTLAFGTDPLARWVYPDPHQYLANFGGIVRDFGGKAFAHDSAYYVDGFAGAALWLPPDVQFDGEALGSHLERTVHESAQAEVFAFLEQMGSYHPKEPHWYLPMIGVDPTKQGQGHGSTLLQHAVRPCDRDGALAYLESSNPRNVPLYQRHGFEVIGTIQVGGSPPVFPMVRKPR
jgi:ribosomal protein S18 acetylase RimI-like enzyme